MRRKDETLRGTLLALARELADGEGLEAVNIRTLAQRAGVAPGTVYNYFSGKEEILLALTEGSWREALEEMEDAVPLTKDFPGQLEGVFRFLGERLRRSPGALMGSLGSAEAAGLERMEEVQKDLESSLVRRMAADPRIREDVWNESFTREGFARFLLGNLMALWRGEAPELEVFLEVVQRIIYGKEGMRNGAGHWRNDL